MVMSSAYVMSLSGFWGCGISDVNMLNKRGERADPCGTPLRML